MTRHPFTHVVAVAAMTLTTACTSAGRPPGARLTPVARRITDETVAHDLATFAALERRAARAAEGTSGERRYLATRAAQYIAIAREAYERNDRSAFPEDMIVLAERDLQLLAQGPGVSLQSALSAALFPNDVRLFGDDEWGRAVALRTDANAVGDPAEIARAESMLIRQGNRILAGPACSDDATVLRHVASILGAVEATRVTPVPVSAAPAGDTTKMVVPGDRPAPVPMPDSARVPRLRGACDAPERLTGVPSAVHFALDKSDLAPATKRVLDRAVEQLRAYPGVRFRLSGHTDPRASNAYNQALSQRRVDAVAAYLASQGIAAGRLLRAEALGEERLLTSATGLRDQARNRRVEVVYILCDGRERVPEETVDDLQLERPRLIEK